MDIVFFIYGLAFFSLGISISTKTKRDSQFIIARHLWLLILFAFTHSVLEWLDLWMIIHGKDHFIIIIRTLPLLISFIFLFEFGRRMLDSYGQYFPPLLIYTVILLFILVNTELSENRLLALDISTRYALAFSGALISGISIMRYFRKEILTIGKVSRVMRLSIYAVSWGFIGYSIFTGLITPKGDSGLAIWLNEDDFFARFGIPVQLFRAACAIIISFGMIKLLNIFNLESEYRLNKAFLTVDNSLAEVKQLEQTLEKLSQTLGESEDRLNRAQAVAGVGSWYLDISTENINWSDETYRIFGIPLKSKITLTSFINSIYPEDRDLVIKNWQAALEGAPYDIEHRIIANGEIKWVRERAEIRFDRNHQALEGIGTVQDITLHKEYELELARSERRMFSVIDASPISKALYDDHGNILYLNHAAVRTFGYRIEEIPTLNDWWPKAYPDPKYRDQVINEWTTRAARNRTGEKFIPMEVHIFCKDGATRIFQAEMASIQYENEYLNLVTLFDITYQRNTTNRLKTLFDVASDGIHIIDERGNIVEFNQAFIRMLGYSDEEAAQLNVSDWEAVIPREHLIDAIAELFKNPATFETKHRRKDGSMFDVEINAKGIELDGRIYLYASSRDISDRVRMQAELLATKKRLEVAASAGVIGIWDLDLISNYLIWDEAMYKLYGIDRNNWDNTSNSWIDKIHPEDRTMVQNTMQESLQYRESEKVFEFRIIWPDGSIHYLKSASRIFYDSEGNAQRAIGVNYDLTEQKNTEQELIEARIKSDAANKAKSSFLANMSHEIRTPMNAVIGLSQLLLDTELTSLQRDYLAKLKNAANSLLGIINDILDYSKIEAGKLDIENVNFELSEIIEHTTGLFKITAENKGLELNFDIDPNIPRILIGDPLRLKQIINNIFGNAIKFTQQGTIRLVINIAEQYDGMVDLQVMISDTGIGMTPTQIAKLFTAFEQADNSMTRKFGGTGLGLTITKQLIEMMGGNILVESVFGQGSTFTFTIPLRILEVPNKPAEKVTSHTNFEQISGIQGAKILLVEDNQINQLVAYKILEKIGLTVTVANNGREGVEKVLAQRYDAILMDLQMPEMDGLEATKRIRAFPQYQDIPIIAMTAATMQEDREASQAAGMNDFVSKPININELQGVLVRWIRK